MSRRPRLALVTEIPAPFRRPLFDALASLVELRVLFLSSHDPRRPHYELEHSEPSFDFRVLPGWQLTRGGRWVVINRGLWGELRRFRPDVIVIGGWNQPAFWKSVAIAYLTRRPVVTWVESTERDWRSGIKPLEIAKRLILRASKAVLVPGQAAAEYAHSLGVPRDRITVAPNAVDLTLFSDAIRSARANRDSLRRSLGVEGTLVLFVGRLAPEKGLDVLLEAVAELDLILAIVGDGPAAEELQAKAPLNVRFVGSLPQSGLVPWYAAADLFVLPSLSEQWGMVLNEAALAGLPLIATDSVGAAYDLIEQGQNGLRVAAGSAAELTEALSSLVSDPERLVAMGNRSREIASRLTPDAWASSVAGLASQLATDGERRDSA